VKHPIAIVAGLACLLALGPPSEEQPPAPSSPAPAKPPLAHLAQHGSTIFADADGAWVIERSVGVLVRVDREGRPHGRLDLSPGLGELIVDDARGLLFVADRAANRVVRVRAGADQDAAPTIVDELALHDPHGLALTPDGETLLVTSVADRELVALATDTLEPRWRVELGAEPQPVAVAPDGRWATVGFPSLPAVAQVELSRGRIDRWHTLETREAYVVWDDYEEDDWQSRERGSDRSRTRYQVPTQLHRERVSNVFVLGYTRDDVAVAHQLATPQLAPGVALFGHALTRLSGSQELAPHQPRALVYDSARGALYVGGYGDDGIVALGDWLGGWRGFLQPGCGLDGLAVDPDGNLWAHCGLSRKVVRIDVSVAPHAEHVIPTPAPPERWMFGPELVASASTPEVERGAQLFRRGASKPACSSCHPDGRSDGQTWRYGEALVQTPMLAGRMSDAHPHGWQRGDATVQAAIERGAKLLGTPKQLSAADLQALQAYLVSLPAPRPPSGDEQAIARGRAHFVELGCQSCHADEHFASATAPALIGLAHSAPYLHDGSAIDLRTMLTGRGSTPHTEQSAALSADALADLIAFLESL
jgi:mono/diheme cytochrome c family protein